MQSEHAETIGNGVAVLGIRHDPKACKPLALRTKDERSCLNRMNLVLD
jgi:hypothetical protein